MPRIWTETIELHRRDVRAAILEATAGLIAEQGLAGTTMLGIAERTGIGRATLYKYFREIDAVLEALHERDVASHLTELGAARERPGTPWQRLERVLETYARLAHASHGSELVARMRHSGAVASGFRQLTGLLQGLLDDALAQGLVREDIPPPELAAFCLAAFGDAHLLPSQAALRRRVLLTLAALRPPP
ncbi:MAG: TetR/AcrR family transcriptional regulator [Myxococcales bacterium]|nr:MAG: TetR/AcrR family transcriptional regulator [Myxococcales bacterium]